MKSLILPCVVQDFPCGSFARFKEPQGTHSEGRRNTGGKVESFFGDFFYKLCMFVCVHCTSSTFDACGRCISCRDYE